MKQKMSSFNIALLLFVAIFGLTNIAANYSEIGQESISWFLLLATYLIPLSFIIGELSINNINSKTGLHGWIKFGLNEKYAFLGAWSYFIVNVFYLPLLASRIPVLFSWTFTSNIDSLNQVVENSGNIPGLINAVDNHFLFLFLTFIALVIIILLSIYFEKFFSSIAKYIGWLSLFITALYIILAIATIFLSNYQVANPLNISEITPNISLKSVSLFAWIVFAISGIETIGSYITMVDKPKKIIPQSIIYASILVIFAYVIGIIATTFIVPPDAISTDTLENVIPIMYAYVGAIWHLPVIFLRLVTLSYLLITLTATVLWFIATINFLFEEFPTGIFPKKVIDYKINNIPILGIFITLLMVVLVLILSNNSATQNVYKTLYDMTSISVLVPYLLLILSYIVHRIKSNEKGKLIKNKMIGIIIGIYVLFITIISIIFSIYDFRISDFSERINWVLTSGGGLIFFLFIGFLIYKFSENNKL